MKADDREHPAVEPAAAAGGVLALQAAGTYLVPAGSVSFPTTWRA